LRIARPVGIPDAELGWRTHAYRPATLRGLPRREFGSGLSATARVMARIGLLLLRGGLWRGTRLLPADYLDRARHARPELAGLLNFETGGPSSLTHHNLYFWNNDDGIAPNLPGDVFFTWGLHNNHAFVVPGLDLVVVRLGTTGFGDDWGSVNRLLGGFVAAVAPSTSAQATLVTRARVPEERLTPAQRRRLRERPITTDE
jgi:CubicO group peptidase (beta-lactamase class C family)